MLSATAPPPVTSPPLPGPRGPISTAVLDALRGAPVAADLTGADLTGADLERAVTEGAKGLN